MTGIFISYRTVDNAYVAEAVYGRFKNIFGRDRVFLDSEELRAGTDFRPELMRRLRQSTVLLCLIGSRWLSETDENGTRLVDRPDDFVRMEIEDSLARDIVVIPVLLDGTPLPDASQLPPCIEALPDHQYREIRRRHMADDIQSLVRVCKEHVPVASAKAAKRSAGAGGDITTGNVCGRESVIVIGHGSSASKQVGVSRAGDHEDEDGDDA